MRCLKCWSEIDGATAIYTKSCQHVFCERCSGKAFKKELSCPLCDLVLPKDGVGEIVLKPDDQHIRKTGSKVFGLEPDKLCEVLQMGLEFWSNQKKNESIQHVQEIQQMQTRLQEVESQAHKYSKALEEEKLKKKSLQNEKESLQRHVAELETRYAEKARAMRKLSELYSELRQVHRRLESDLRGVRTSRDYDQDELDLDEIEVQTRGTAVKRVQEKRAPEQRRQEGREEENCPEQSEQISFEGMHEYNENRRTSNSQVRVAPPSRALSNSAALETLFTLAPTTQAPPFTLNIRGSKEKLKPRRRRQHSAISNERAGDGKEGREVYSAKPKRGTRR